MTHRYRDIRPIYRTKGWPLRGALFIPCSSRTSPPKALNEKNPVDRVYRVFLNTMQAWRWVEIAHDPSLSRYSPYCRTEGWPLCGISFIPCESNHH